MPTTRLPLLSKEDIKNINYPESIELILNRPLQNYEKKLLKNIKSEKYVRLDTQSRKTR